MPPCVAMFWRPAKSSAALADDRAALAASGEEKAV